MIVMKLKYLYSVLPCRKELTKNKALNIQIEVFEFLIDSKKYEIFVFKNRKRVNYIISTYLCI